MTSMPGTNSSDDYSLNNSASNLVLQPSIAVRVCVLGLLIPIPVFAIMGNLFIMAAVARFQSLQTPTNAFVVSLAVADFLVAVLVMPFSLVRTIDRWYFGRCFCKVHFLLDVTLCTSSIFNLSCIALDRYVAVCAPLHYPSRMSPRRVAVLLLLCWVLPLVLSSLCVSLGTFSLPHVETLSSSSRRDPQICAAMFRAPYAFTSSAIAFFIPMGFMLFAYGRILRAAQRQARWIHAAHQHTEQLQNQNPVRTDATRPAQTHVDKQRRDSKAVKTLGLIVGVFLFCWCPFFCLNVINPLKGYTFSPLVLEVSLWLGYANSSLNPFLYVLLNKNYRHVFTAMLDCGPLGRPPRAGLVSSVLGRRAHTVMTLETISR